MMSRDKVTERFKFISNCISKKKKKSYSAELQKKLLYGIKLQPGSDSSSSRPHGKSGILGPRNGGSGKEELRA